jgi:four helix bundle protein
MKILDMMVEMVRVVHAVAGKVARHDRDLAQQMKRASTSVALNGSEGIWAKAGKRRSRLEDAVNSARETLMALRVAGACGYLPADEAAAAVGEVDSVIRVLWVLAYRR